MDEDEAMVGDGLRVPAEEVGVDVQRAGHLRRDGEVEIGVALIEIEIAGEDGLAVA